MALTVDKEPHSPVVMKMAMHLRHLTLATHIQAVEVRNQLDFPTEVEALVEKPLASESIHSDKMGMVFDSCLAKVACPTETKEKNQWRNFLKIEKRIALLLSKHIVYLSCLLTRG